MDPQRPIYPQRARKKSVGLIWRMWRISEIWRISKDSRLRTQNSGLRTQNSGLRTQDSGLGIQNSGLRSVRFFTRDGFCVTCNVRDAGPDGGARCLL